VPPLFPYLPFIVWMGILKVMLGTTRDIIDPTDLADHSNIIPFPPTSPWQPSTDCLIEVM